MEERLSRKIGERDYGVPGPLLLVTTQIHGNEPAGTLAFERLLHMIDGEWEKNPAFGFTGKIVGLRGNLQAITEGTRYVEQDLNRMWKQENIALLLSKDLSELREEELECILLHTHMQHEIDIYQPEFVFVLDLHTTTAAGGIFTIPSDHDKAHEIAKRLHAPIVHGLIGSLEGTLAEYVLAHPWGVPSYSLVFEAGQHHAPSSTQNAISALVHTLQALKMVKVEDVEHFHKQRLQYHASGLPLETQLLYRHKVMESDHFHMLPGFFNFMPVYKGQALARDKEGTIASPHEGYILMPLYQRQGEDGFFLLGEIRE